MTTSKRRRPSPMRCVRNFRMALAAALPLLQRAVEAGNDSASSEVFEAIDDVGFGGNLRDFRKRVRRAEKELAAKSDMDEKTHPPIVARVLRRKTGRPAWLAESDRAEGAVKFVIVLTRAGKGWAASSPTLPGACAQGRTKDSARKNVISAIRSLLAVYRDANEKPPLCEIVIDVADVTAGSRRAVSAHARSKHDEAEHE